MLSEPKITMKEKKDSIPKTKGSQSNRNVVNISFSMQPNFLTEIEEYLATTQKFLSLSEFIRHAVSFYLNLESLKALLDNKNPDLMALLEE